MAQQWQFETMTITSALCRGTTQDTEIRSAASEVSCASRDEIKRASGQKEPRVKAREGKGAG